MISIIIFIFGLIIGSFLNVVIYRMKDLHSIITTRSHCPKCKKEIAWYDLIPFLSFVILKTRCRYCAKPISWQYPLVEFGTALLTLSLFLYFGNQLHTYVLIFVSYFLIVIFVYDLKTMIIPDEMFYPAFVLSLVYAMIAHYSNFKIILLSLLVGTGFLAIIYLLGKGKWMGMGDVKLAAIIGLLVPFPLVLVSLFAAFILGSIVGLCLLILKLKTLKSEVPFGPFLILGLYISLFCGEKIINWYLNII